MRDTVTFIGLLVVAGTSTACEPPGCVQIEHPPVTDPQTSLIIGGTYGEALTTIVGTLSGPMQWRGIEPPTDIDGLPPPGETRLTVTVLEPSMAEQHEFERGRIPRNERLICDDPTLFAELEIDLRSDDGLFDARIPAIVTLRNPASASIFARHIDDHDLGDLELTPTEPAIELLLEIWIRHASEEPKVGGGTLTLRWAASDDDGSGAGWSDELATWTLE